MVSPCYREPAIRISIPATRTSTRRDKARLAIQFPRHQIPNAQVAEVSQIALIDFSKRQILGPDNVLALLHFLTTQRRSGDERAIRPGANSELAGGGLVIRIGEASTDASLIHDTTDSGTRSLVQYKMSLKGR